MWDFTESLYRLSFVNKTDAACIASFSRDNIMLVAQVRVKKSLTKCKIKSVPSHPIQIDLSQH